MPNTQTRLARGRGGWWWKLLLLVALAAGPLSAVEIRLPLLKIGTDVFTNVTVYEMSQTDIFVRHERGFGNAKISKLDDDTLKLLGLKTAQADKPKAGGGTLGAFTADHMKSALASVHVNLPADSSFNDLAQNIQAKPQVLFAFLAVLVLGYLFYCLCLHRICVNAGSKPGVLVWLPIFQVFPLLRAARMPAWWILIFLVPLLNILAHLLWCARITRACGKGLLAALLLFLPVTNFIALIYLAFSGGSEPPVTKTLRPEDLPGLAGA